jgi:16S rRNA processing protein RimM
MQLTVGRIGRAHGLRGEVTVDVRTDDPAERFAPGVSLETEPAHRGPLTVASARQANGRLLVCFAGVGDRSAAEALRGTRLVVEADRLRPPEDPDEFYDHQLIGLRVVSVGGVAVGTLTDVLHLPGGDVLAVSRPDAPELLVPFVAAIVPEVDVPGGRVVIDPPPGLLELAGGPGPLPEPEP